jgi:hypothetical protein
MEKTERNAPQDIFSKGFRQHSFLKGNCASWTKRGVQAKRLLAEAIFSADEVLPDRMAKALQRLKVAGPHTPQGEMLAHVAFFLDQRVRLSDNRESVFSLRLATGASAGAGASDRLRQHSRNSV